MVTFKTTKIMNVPLKYAYAWCTDFRDDDSKITGSVRIRRVISRTKDRVIYGSSYPGRDGKATGSIYIVSLKPPDSWHMDRFGEDMERGDYKLTSLGRKLTRLDITFNLKFKRGSRRGVNKEDLSKRSLERWNKYAAALESDYASGVPP